MERGRGVGDKKKVKCASSPFSPTFPFTTNTRAAHAPWPPTRCAGGRATVEQNAETHQKESKSSGKEKQGKKHTSFSSVRHVARQVPVDVAPQRRLHAHPLRLAPSLLGGGAGGQGGRVGARGDAEGGVAVKGEGGGGGESRKSRTSLSLPPSASPSRTVPPAPAAPPRGAARRRAGAPPGGSSGPGASTPAPRPTAGPARSRPGRWGGGGRRRRRRSWRGTRTTARPRPPPPPPPRPPGRCSRKSLRTRPRCRPRRACTEGGGGGEGGRTREERIVGRLIFFGFARPVL